MIWIQLFIGVSHVLAAHWEWDARARGSRDSVWVRYPPDVNDHIEIAYQNHLLNFDEVRKGDLPHRNGINLDVSYFVSNKLI